MTGFITIGYMVCERACMLESGEGVRECGCHTPQLVCLWSEDNFQESILSFHVGLQASHSGGQSCLVSTFHLLSHLASPETGLLRHVIYRVKFTFHGDTGTN